MSESTAPPFLTSALASRPGHFVTGEIASDTHWIGGSVGSRAGLDAVEERKPLFLPVFQPGPFIQ
jgi:hypothetical protein